MNIVIVGCGRVGARLAGRFVEQGHTVSVVDKERSAFARLGEGFKGKTVLGLGFDEDVLKKARIETADVFLAITGGDNGNLMAAQIAQEKYHIPKVIVRVKDPLRAEVYQEMGLRTYCTTLIGSNILEDVVLGRPLKSIEEYIGFSSPSLNGASGNGSAPGESAVASDSAPVSRP
jgi:trk system potassium uptake protein TrkA